MSCANEKPSSLRAMINALKKENNELRKAIDRISRTTSRSVGIVGENYVAKILGLKVKGARFDHDFETPKGKRVEVKSSKLFSPSKAAATKRWTWHRPLGWSGGKSFDFLLLLGEKDFRYKYRSRNAPYVMFLVPWRSVPTVSTRKGHDMIINLTTNPATGRGRASALFAQFEVSGAELKMRLNLR